MSHEFPPSPRIITFYSFKGGTGRTMAMANIAWILASNGRRVLAIDWDLEAPGLHRYFVPFLEDPELTQSKGLIDILIDYMIAATKPRRGSVDSHWFESFADVTRFAEPILWDFPGEGAIDLLFAGRQREDYASRINSFDWAVFYEKFGGGAFLERLITKCREEYDYVLIDSRTGLSDTMGICTLHLPTALVVLYTLNNQSILGAANVANAIRRAQREHGVQKFPIFPVAARVELGEKDRLNARRRLAASAFEGVLEFLSDEEQRAYLGDMEIVYDPYYAYEETLATIADQPNNRNSVLSALEALTAVITHGEVSKTQHFSHEMRAEIKQQYEQYPEKRSPTEKQLAPDVVVISDAEVKVVARQFASTMSPHCRVFSDEYVRVGHDRTSDLSVAAKWASIVAVFLPHGKLTLAPSLEEQLKRVFENTGKHADERKIVPVVVGGIGPGELPGPLARFKPLWLADGHKIEVATTAVLKMLNMDINVQSNAIYGRKQLVPFGLGTINLPTSWEVRSQITLLEPENRFVLGVEQNEHATALSSYRPQPRNNVVISRQRSRETAESALTEFLEQTAASIPEIEIHIENEAVTFTDGVIGASTVITFAATPGIRLAQRHFFRVDDGVLTQLVVTVESSKISEVSNGLGQAVLSYNVKELNHG